MLRVLLIEDSADDAKLVEHALRAIGRPLHIERVEDEAAMRTALQTKPWDVVLSDWSLPRFSGPAALEVLKSTALDLPFIIVSGTVGEEAAVEAMRAGAHDYVLKDRLVRLAPAIERELRETRERAARRATEIALAESETRFRRLAESGIIGITIADDAGNIVDANDACIEMLGFSREELVAGKVRWFDRTPPEYRAVAERAGEQLSRTGVARAWEMELVRKDGTRVPIMVGAAMLESQKSIAFVVDLSERRRAEEASAKLALALRQSEEQLRQAQKMEAIGRLAGGVAHDFNNMLSVILSYSELIAADVRPSDPMRDDIEEIRKAAQRAAGLTRQLLLFSRQQVVQPKVLDLNEILSGLDKMLQRIVGEDIELVSSTEAEASRVRVDPSHIEQVILNLVVNARDAMPTGGKLTIQTANVTLDDEFAAAHVPLEAGGYVRLAITDNGCGMDSETQRRIFEPFFTTKEVGKGTGLGLSTVFGIVQQSGGLIEVASEVGHGTTFKIYLRTVSEAVDSLRAPVMPSTARATETILVVEDEDQLRAIVVSVLRKDGYSVLAAQNGGEALLLCEKTAGHIDLLLTDVVMPQMSGPALAKRLCALRPGLKVLCVSGYTDDSIFRHGVIEGHVAFLQKPFTPASLRARIREVLDA